MSETCLQKSYSHRWIVTECFGRERNFVGQKGVKMALTYQDISRFVKEPSATATEVTVLRYLISSPNTSISSEVVILAAGDIGTSIINVELTPALRP